MPLLVRHLLLLIALAAGTSALAVAVEPPAAPTRLTPQQLDALVAAALPELKANGAADQQFLRRACFDLVGRQPSLEEQQQFVGEASPAKSIDLVERLLASPEFGDNWANYWTDTIAFRVPPPELTYLNYGPLKKWLAEKFNANVSWDQITRELLTAEGKIDEHPAATFIGYHQADATNLAGETSRIFLGQQIGCAQCHDHPFDHWKRTQFHELAAFFARAKAKLSQNDGAGTVVSAVAKGEYQMPDMADPANKGVELKPAFLTGENLDEKLADAQRRAQLAAFVTSPANPWYAKAYVNRIWARLMGQGFYEPVDDLGDSRTPFLPTIHDALARHFVASGYDVKDLFRLIMTSTAYQRGGLLGVERPQMAGAVAAADAPRLRGDEVFAALRVGLELPNVTPPKTAATGQYRFPPPPKSTRDLIQEAFGIDPSLAPSDTPRTIDQALWMMNNEQLQRQINGARDSGTMLARLLAAEPDNQKVCEQLYSRTMARQPTAEELRIALAHVTALGDRRIAFEDLLWGLVNSAEFTSRR